MSSSNLMRRPIFIGGPGRSGTTLLRTILSAHSNIAIAPETHYFEWVSSKHNLHNGPNDFEEFWSRYTSWSRFKDLGVDAERCRELVDQLGDRTFENVFDAVLCAYRERLGKDRGGEKTPGNEHFLDVIFDWYPDARVIVTQRDPRAVIASQLKTAYVRDRMGTPSLRGGLLTATRSNEIAFFAKKWNVTYNDVLPFWSNDNRVAVVPYESMVSDPEESIRKVCDFVEEDFEETMLESGSRSKVPEPAGGMRTREQELWRREHIKKTAKPITAGSLEKWKSDLSRTEVAMIEGFCERGMKALGYPPSLPASHRAGGGALTAGVLLATSAETKAREGYRAVRRRVRSDSQ